MPMAAEGKSICTAFYNPYKLWHCFILHNNVKYHLGFHRDKKKCESYKYNYILKYETVKRPDTEFEVSSKKSPQKDKQEQKSPGNKLISNWLMFLVFQKELLDRFNTHR
eukprot:UN21472